MSARHPLLARQLRKAFGERALDDAQLAAFVRAVDDAYQSADDERRQLERSLHLASDELYERNRRLESELEERKRLEIELRQAEKMRAVGSLAAGVAHEINTPVQFIGDSVAFLGDAFGELERVIAESTRLAARDDVGDLPAAFEALGEGADLAYLREEVPRAIHRCVDGVHRVATIVRALKTLAHPDAPEQVHFDLNAAITNTLVVCGSEIKYVADVELDLAATRLLCGHPGELQQVLLNLLVNAAHAIDERAAGTGRRGVLRVSSRDDGDDVVIAVADDGAGIPPAARDRIFEPFFTTKPVGKGTGQGLSISRSMIVDHHGGQLTFESTLGTGTTFTVRLPVAGRPAAR